jgi:hypothetical protein
MQVLLRFNKKYYSKSIEVVRKNLQNGPNFESFLNSKDNISGDSRLPPWLKNKLPSGTKYFDMKKSLRHLKLSKVYILERKSQPYLNFICN